MEPVPQVAVVVTAAGLGERLGGAVPKAFVDVGGHALVRHAVERAAQTQGVHWIVVTAPPAYIAQCRDIVADALVPARVDVRVIPGAHSRHLSVARAVAALSEDHTCHPTVVLVHDAARAFTPTAVFDRVVDAVSQGSSAVVPALALTDTVKRVRQDSDALRVAHTVPRETLRAIQTPQGFPWTVLRALYADAGSDQTLPERLQPTDDAGLAERAGIPVTVVTGSPDAEKITTPDDLAAARRRWVADRAPQFRVGVGVDVHAFAAAGEDRQLWLAGLYWEAERGLAGHSDADVAAHAAADAILQAAGVGDLGSVFGTADPQWAAASGSALLAHAAALVNAAGWKIGNIGLQLIGPRPRLASRRQEAQAALSAAAGAPVTVSATTTDGLGFSGRGEGLAAIATALLYAHGDDFPR